MTDWMDGEVQEKRPLTDEQAARLLAMNELLRTDKDVFLTVAAMKDAFGIGDDFAARGLWDDLSEEEQETLWVAAKFGGIFTTREREIIRESD